MNKIFLVVVSMIWIGISGCSYDLDIYQEPVLTFDHVTQTRVPVQKIDVENRSTRQSNFSVNPLPETFERLVRAKLQPGGTTGRLLFVIDEAYVTESRDRYDSVLTVNAEHYDAWDNLTRRTTIKANRGVSLPVDVTLEKRDRLRFEMIEKLMQDVEGQVSSVLSAPEPR